MYFLNRLFESVLELKQEMYIIDKFIPESVKIRSNLYLLACCDIHEMFVENYREDLSGVGFLSMKEICFNIKHSVSFYGMSKTKQKSLKNDVIYDFFKTNPAYKQNYKERHEYEENGIRVQVRNVLLGFKKKDMCLDESI